MTELIAKIDSCKTTSEINYLMAKYLDYFSWYPILDYVTKETKQRIRNQANKESNNL